jgi:hypothetical protein
LRHIKNRKKEAICYISQYIAVYYSDSSKASICTITILFSFIFFAILLYRARGVFFWSWNMFVSVNCLRFFALSVLFCGACACHSDVGTVVPWQHRLVVPVASVVVPATVAVAAGVTGVAALAEAVAVGVVGGAVGVAAVVGAGPLALGGFVTCAGLAAVKKFQTDINSLNGDLEQCNRAMMDATNAGARTKEKLKVHKENTVVERNKCGVEKADIQRQCDADAFAVLKQYHENMTSLREQCTANMTDVREQCAANMTSVREQCAANMTSAHELCRNEKCKDVADQYDTTISQCRSEVSACRSDVSACRSDVSALNTSVSQCTGERDAALQRGDGLCNNTNNLLDKYLDLRERGLDFNKCWFFCSKIQDRLLFDLSSSRCAT